MLTKDSAEDSSHCSNLPFPHSTHMTGTRWVESPINLLFAELLGNLVMIHFFYGFTKLPYGTNKIGSVVASNFAHRTSASNKAARNVFRNESVSSELETSMWIALLTRHVNNAPYRSRSCRPSFVMYRPKKSTPT